MDRPPSGKGSADEALGYAARRAVTGRGDLVADVANGDVDLAEVAEADLPEELKGLDAEERQAAVGVRMAERAAINQKLEALARERAGWLAEAARAERKPDSFDAKVSEMIERQMARVAGRGDGVPAP
jgi:hypothetical protein